MTTIALTAAISTVIAVYSIIPYVTEVIKGNTRPHQLSWLVFVIMNGIVFFSQYFEGGRGSILIALAFFVGSLLVLGLSFRYGTRDTSKWDKLLFGFALITIVVWFLTRSNATAIWLTLIIDVAATSMIILKLRSQPRSESAKPWIIATCAYVFSCLSLIGTPVGILYVRPIYGLVCDVAIVAAIYYYHKRSTAVMTTSPAEI